MMTRQTMAMQSNAGHQMMPGAQGAASHTLHQNDPRAQGMMGQQPHGDPQASFDTATHASSAQQRRYIYTHDNTEQTFFLRSEEHTSELQSLMRLSDAVFCLKK